MYKCVECLHTSLDKVNCMGKKETSKIIGNTTWRKERVITAAEGGKLRYFANRQS